MDIKEIVAAIKAGKLDESTAAIKTILSDRSAALVESGYKAMTATIFENEVFNDQAARAKAGSQAAADHTKAVSTIQPHGNASHTVEEEPVVAPTPKSPGISTTKKVPGYTAPKINNYVAQEPAQKKVAGADATEKTPGLGEDEEDK